MPGLRKSEFENAVAQLRAAHETIRVQAQQIEALKAQNRRLETRNGQLKTENAQTAETLRTLVDAAPEDSGASSIIEPGFSPMNDLAEWRRGQLGL
jgi:hypothetical protein